MLPRWHLLISFFISYVLVYFFHFSLFAGVVIFFSSILIDLDHVLLYFLKTKDLSPKGFFEWIVKQEKCYNTLSKEEKKEYKTSHYIFHGAETLLFLVLLSFFSKFFLLILYGVLLHLVLDLIELYRLGIPLSPKVSQIWLWQINKKKKGVNKSCFVD